jgi:hypothetical protein
MSLIPPLAGAAFALHLRLDWTSALFVIGEALRASALAANRYEVVALNAGIHSRRRERGSPKILGGGDWL